MATLDPCFAFLSVDDKRMIELTMKLDEAGIPHTLIKVGEQLKVNIRPQHYEMAMKVLTKDDLPDISFTEIPIIEVTNERLD